MGQWKEGANCNQHTREKFTFLVGILKSEVDGLNPSITILGISTINHLQFAQSHVFKMCEVLLCCSRCNAAEPLSPPSVIDFALPEHRAEPNC